MFKLQKQIGLMTIPKEFITDKELSIIAKGILCSLYHCGDLENVKEEKDFLRPYIKEIIKKGYAFVENDEIVIRNKKYLPKRKINDNKVSSIEKSNKSTSYTTIIEMINNYTEDNELRELLVAYYKLRLQKPKNSELFMSRTYPKDFERILNTLDSFKGNKHNIIKNAIDKKLRVLVDCNRFDSANIDSLEDDKEIATYIEERQKEGKQWEF